MRLTDFSQVSQANLTLDKAYKDILENNNVKRLNHLMILHIHKALTDKLSVERIANEFVSRKEERLRIFGKF